MLGAFSYTHAATLAWQPIRSTISTTTYQGNPYTLVLNGVTTDTQGVVLTAGLYIHSTNPSGSCFILTNITQSFSSDSECLPAGGQDLYLILGFSGSHTTYVGDTWRIEANDQAPFGTVYWGDSNGTPYVNIFDADGCSSSCPSSLELSAWRFNEYPPDGSFGATSTVTFSDDFYLNCAFDYGSYDTMSIDIRDVSSSNFVLSPPSQPVSVCGLQHMQVSMVLPANQQYIWRPVAYSSTGTSTNGSLVEPLYGSWTSLNTSATLQMTLGTAVGANTGNASVSTSSLLSFLNVPYLLQTKMPFGYFFEAKDAILAGLNGTSTYTAPPSEISIRIGQSTTTFDAFSTTTIAKFLPPSLVSPLRLILLYLLYAEFVYVMYHRAKSLKLV